MPLYRIDEAHFRYVNILLLFVMVMQLQNVLTLIEHFGMSFKTQMKNKKTEWEIRKGMKRQTWLCKLNACSTKVTNVGIMTSLMKKKNNITSFKTRELLF